MINIPESALFNKVAYIILILAQKWAENAIMHWINIKMFMNVI